jgi:hypothetical protein
MSLQRIKDSLSGSEPRSSEGIYNAATEKASNLFSSNKSSASRLLSVPEKLTSPDLAESLSSTTSTAATGKTSIWRYLFIFLILLFLFMNLMLFLLKPTDMSMSYLYDPVLDFSNRYFNTNFKGSGKDNKKGPIVASVSKKNNEAAVKKLEKTLDKKPIINNIDNKNVKSAPPSKTSPLDQPAEPEKRSKKLPVIPEADDSTSSIQMKPTSKSGFCYIGEDRGFRNCINVGEGDVCMSGDIFPTEAICINPNLRE